MKATASILLMCVTISAWAAFDAGQWGWECAIETGNAPAGFVRLPLTPEMLDQSAPDLRDLRVVDSQGRIVPYMLHTECAADRRQVEWRDARLLDRTFARGEYERTVLDFGMRAEKNQVRLDLGDGFYCRQVLVEGGQDGAAWETVAENVWVARLEQNGNQYVLDTVEFPTNTFQYLRLTVYLMPEDEERIAIRQARSALVLTEPAGALIPVPLKVTSFTQDAKTKQTVIELDAGYRNLPITRLDLDFEDPYFHRGYELRGRGALTVERPGYTASDTIEADAPWCSVDAGVIYRVQKDASTAERVRLTGLDAPYRYFQLRISNGDNPPLTLRGTMTAQRREIALLFDCDPKSGYTLYGGNPKAAAPQFDLAQAAPQLDERTLPVVPTGSVVPRQLTEPVLPWTERHAVVIWIVLGVAVIAMFVLLASNLKKLGPKTE